MIRAALRATDAACFAGAAVAAVAAAALAAMLIAEVVLTYFFATSQPWVIEYAIYLQAMILFCGSGWALRQGGHIRVAVLLHALPPRLARALDMLGTAFAIGTLGFLTRVMWLQWWRSVELGSISFYPMGTPVWVPQGLLTLGITLLLLAFVARLVRLLAHEAPDLGAGLAGGGHE
ncbi:TRAP transporter small permease subunit [Roseomonas sp. HF4]|uniref:TRAP transporter small permease subunit n=1 Tax=Roseomonas sp. HF4 TaxID=2562313 RepID=UPI001F103F87|nr:TRAP transporter small permease [Roseomonas sp. HF4]